VASQYSYPGSSPGQVMWNLWWIKWHWDTFHPSSECFGFPLQLFHQLLQTHHHHHHHPRRNKRNGGQRAKNSLTTPQGTEPTNQITSPDSTDSVL
jgi:hypothetical protein